jgi:hypothetical protein
MLAEAFARSAEAVRYDVAPSSCSDAVLADRALDPVVLDEVKATARQ